MFQRLLLLISLLTAVLVLFAQPGLPAEYFDKAEVFRQNANRDSAAHYYILAGDGFIASGENQEAAESYNQVGAALNRIDQYDRAKVYLEKAYSLGGQGAADSLTFATTNINLGVLYSALEKYNESLEYHFKALEIRIAILDTINADVATSYGNIANVYFNSGQYELAVENHLYAKAIRYQLYGDEGNEIIQSYTGLGNAYRELKQYDQSLVYFHKALKLKMQYNGKGHPDLIKYYERLATVYYLSGDKKLGDYYSGIMNDIRSKAE